MNEKTVFKPAFNIELPDCKECVKEGRACDN